MAGTILATILGAAYLETCKILSSVLVRRTERLFGVEYVVSRENRHIWTYVLHGRVISKASLLIPTQNVGASLTRGRSRGNNVVKS